MSSEQDPLLSHRSHYAPSPKHDDEIHQQGGGRSIRRAPFVAFLATFAMTAAAASSVFVFARILCKNPAACDKNEQAAFSKLLAIATTVANVCAIIAIQPLHMISKKRPKLVLLLWLTCRGSSVGLLWLASRFKSIKIVFLSKILEGTATDNILQFALSTIYTRAPDGKKLSTLMAESMAFSLLGSSIGPLVAGFSRDFSNRVAISLCTMVIAALYTILAVQVSPRKNPGKSPASAEDSAPVPKDEGEEGLLRKLTNTFFSHLSILFAEPVFIAPGLALMLYTIGQAYVLPALMVFASGRYGFTDRQNSWLLSLATAVSASFIFLVRFTQRTYWGNMSPLLFNVITAIIGMAALAISLPLVMETKASGHMYLIASTMSLGLTSSSFIKTYALLQIQQPEDGTAALAIFETVGSFLSPPAIGAAQTNLAEGRWTFVSTGMMAAATIVLLVSYSMRSTAKVADRSRNL